MILFESTSGHDISLGLAEVNTTNQTTLYTFIVTDPCEKRSKLYIKVEYQEGRRTEQKESNVFSFDLRNEWQCKEKYTQNVQEEENNQSQEVEPPYGWIVGGSAFCLLACFMLIFYCSCYSNTSDKDSPVRLDTNPVYGTYYDGAGKF